MLKTRSSANFINSGNLTLYLSIIFQHIVNDKRVRAVIKETSLIGKRNILIGKLIMFHQIDLLYIIAKLSRTSFR